MSALRPLPIIQRDPGFVGASLAQLDQQLLDGWRQLKGVAVPESYRRVERLVVAGMGGSHLAADIIRSVMADRLPDGIQIVADYRLPAAVNQRALVVCSSYSGSTEETMETLKAAVKRRSPVAVLTSGGKLADAARYYRVPQFQFTPSANPSGQPRLGLGYGLAGLLSLLWKIGWIANPTELLTELQGAAARASRSYGPAHRVDNPAWELALGWKGGVPLLIGLDWMAGNLHTFANQLHENAKTYAVWYLLPDLNHHLLEGMRNRSVTRQFRVLAVDDLTGHDRNRARLKLTARLMKKLGAQVRLWKPRGSTRWERAIDLLVFGGYTSWYLAAIRQVKPAPIPTVDELKAALARAR